MLAVHLLEKSLVRDKKWTEFSVYPLFSPMSLIAEGSANYGIEMAFTEDERLAFERDVLYPMAGIDPALAGKYLQLRKLTGKLSYSDNACRHALPGSEMDARADHRVAGERVTGAAGAGRAAYFLL